MASWGLQGQTYTSSHPPVHFLECTREIGQTQTIMCGWWLDVFMSIGFKRTQNGIQDTSSCFTSF